MRQQLDTAIRLTLAAECRNRLAWILLVAFIPVWYLLMSSMFAHAGAGFRLQATGVTLVVDGHNLALISAGLNSITLITAFVVFAAVRRSRLFDRRLGGSNLARRPDRRQDRAPRWSRRWPLVPMPRPSCCSSGALKVSGR